MNKILVPPTGSPTSSIAFIGEAPGEDEIVKLEPFVGKAGEVFDYCLASAGIERRDIYIDNVVPERPRYNDISKFVTITQAGNATKTDLFQEYELELIARLRKCKANVFVPMGNVSLWVLTGKTAITKQRGSVLEATAEGLEGRKVIPVIHPANALMHREPKNKRLIIQDFLRIKKQAEFPEIVRVNRDLEALVTFNQAKSWLIDCLKLKTLYYDIEMLNQELSCISIGKDEITSKCIVFASYNSRVNHFLPEEEVKLMNLLAELLENPEYLKIGHNLSFDNFFLLYRYGIIVRHYEDTMVAQGIIAPDYPKRLEFLLTSYGEGEPYYKDSGKAYMKYGGNEVDFWKYNNLDSITCAISYPKQMTILKKNGQEETYKWTIRLMPALQYMQSRAIRIDTEKRKRESHRLGIEAEGVLKAFHEIVGSELNPNSSQQMAEYFYTDKGLKIIRDPKTRKMTTSEDAMKRIGAQGYPEAFLVMKYRKLITMNSKYYLARVDKNGRLTGSYNPVGTETLRLSAGKSIIDNTGLNTLTYPHPFKLGDHKFSFKSLLLADPGYIVYAPDLSQAENRIVAYMANDTAMKKAFRDGKDLHKITAGDLHGKLPEEISDEEGSSPFGDGTKSERFWGKTANHALDYDMGYRMLAWEYELLYKEAKRIYNIFHTKHPNIQSNFQAQIMKKLYKDRTLVNLMGDRRIFLDDLTRVKKSAYAHIPQSTVAAIINRWGVIPIWEDSFFSQVELLNQVHDQLWFQIPISAGWQYHYEVCCKLRENIEKPLEWRGEKFTIPLDFTMGLNFGSGLYDFDLDSESFKETFDLVVEESELELQLTVQEELEQDYRVSR